MTLRSPLARVLSYGAAHGGVGHWITERLSAIALAPLVIWLLYQLLSLPNADYATVSVWVAAGWNPVWLALLVTLGAWHSWLGVQMAVEDYVHGALLKGFTLMLSTAIHGLLAISGVYALLRLAFRSAA